MKQSIRAKITSTVAFLILFTVAIISFLSNYFINKQFQTYITKEEREKAEFISQGISDQYLMGTDTWNHEYIHAFGMYSLYDGYILKVLDNQGNVVWDARTHDMSICNHIMEDIMERMNERYPQIKGELTTTTYVLLQGQMKVGTVEITYFGPFFLSENDSIFLEALNRVLIGVGTVSLIIAIIIGYMIAKRLSQPILSTVKATKKIADGNYSVRIKDTSNTKELNMLMGSINHLAASLETQEHLRKQLTSDVAHELRTPLTIMQSFIEAMMEGVWEPTQERLESCYDEIGRITNIVNDLEQLSKLEGNLINLEMCTLNLNEVIDKVVSTLEVEISDRNLVVTVDSGKEILVTADENRIMQVIRNLLTNAIKYSREGDRITITLFDTEKEVGFHVADTGLGIPLEELPFIFERFYRADKSRNRSTGGTGIGLTIVKSIVEAHQGNVTVESKVNEGTCFTVRLPKKI
ncbi:MAG TPA: HAMP domain-containing sensor histidine kinase [Lachnospiraceae bacterium]|nr:HAMP domain-containing sensor histidine kinase [Lachnospiraceae bacterium]